LTHGTAVWGHEFGFFKDPNDCGVDTLWLTFSSSDERVKEFVGKDVVIGLNIDGKEFDIKTPMLSSDTIGFTHVMMFTNWEADSQFVTEILNGKRAVVKIKEPAELEGLLDIKEDEFGLDGFVDSREEAMAICKENEPSIDRKSAVWH